MNSDLLILGLAAAIVVFMFSKTQKNNDAKVTVEQFTTPSDEFSFTAIPDRRPVATQPKASRPKFS